MIGTFFTTAAIGSSGAGVLRGSYGSAPIKPVNTDSEFIRTPLPPQATTAGASGFVNCEDAACDGYGYPHQLVQNALLAAFNKPSLMAGIVDMFADDEAVDGGKGVSYCDPFPQCVYGKEAVGKHLTSIAGSLVDSFMLPLKQAEQDEFRIGSGGGFYAPSLTMSVKQSDEANTAWQAKWNTTKTKTCIVGGNQYVQWFFQPNSTKLSQVRIFYDEKSRRSQADKCGSSLMIGDGKGPDHRQALEGVFDTLLKVNDVPVIAPENVRTWMSLFDPSKLDEIEICAMQPYCMYGKEAYDGLWGWQATDGENEKIFLTSPIMVSGNVASAMTSFSNTDGGCLENHLQFMTFTLAEGSDRARALSIIAAPSAVAMKLHDCHGAKGEKEAPKKDTAVSAAIKGAAAATGAAPEPATDGYTSGP